LEWFELQFLQKNSLFFENNIAKDCETVMSFDPSQKEYVTKLPGDLFVVKRIVTRYDIAKVLKLF